MSIAKETVAGGGRVRIPSLDGLRALSIAFVLLGHLAGTRYFPSTQPRSFTASLGVRVFFVISGYLITHLLLEERTPLGIFYFRRIFRILVPYYAFLAVIALAAHHGLIQLAPGDLGYALAYASNYHQHGEWALGHTWSLAVEEQFYLLWPALLALLGARRAMWLAAAYIVVAPAGRLFVWYLHPDLRAGIGHTFGTVADTIAAGCLLAGISGSLWARAWYRKLLGSRWFVLVPVAVLSMFVVEDRPRLAYTVGAVVVNIGVALTIDHCLRFPKRLLAAAPLVAIGRASYSIYLWQQPFLNRSSPSSWFPANLLAVAIVATVAYFVVEKPAMAARSRIEHWLRRGRFASPASPVGTPSLVPATSAPPAS